MVCSGTSGSCRSLLTAIFFVPVEMGKSMVEPGVWYDGILQEASCIMQENDLTEKRQTMVD